MSLGDKEDWNSSWIAKSPRSELFYQAGKIKPFECRLERFAFDKLVAFKLVQIWLKLRKSSIQLVSKKSYQQFFDPKAALGRFDIKRLVIGVQLDNEMDWTKLDLANDYEDLFRL